MIEVTELCKVFTRITSDGEKKRFGKKVKVKEEEFLAVDHISFKAEKGEIVGILGPNGAGKTTLLRMLAGILTPTSGSVEICGYNYEEEKNLAKREIGYLSGNTRLYGRFSPREIMTIFGKMYEMDEKSIKESIERISEILSMDEFIDNRIENLSTGQTQRTSIARCLIHSPSVYIFDEPTLGLDILSSRAIIDFMLREKQNGKTVLYSTHYMKEAETLCDRIILIYEGKIIAEGKPADLMRETNSKSLRQVFIKLADKEVGLNED